MTSALAQRAVLYVDDAHGTGVIGRKGRGTVLDALGNYDNTLVVGSLSKGFSCVGGFIGCTHEFKRLLKMRSNTYIFGGPVPPPYLEAVCTVCDILDSGEYDLLRGRLATAISPRLTSGLQALGPGGAGRPDADRLGAGRRRGGHAATPAIPLRAGLSTCSR